MKSLVVFILFQLQFACNGLDPIVKLLEAKDLNCDNFVIFSKVELDVTSLKLSRVLATVTEAKLGTRPIQHEAENVLSPVVFGHFRFIPQCSVVMFRGLSEIELEISVGQSLLKKLAIPTRDIFIFHTTPDVITKLHQNGVMARLSHWLVLSMETSADGSTISASKPCSPAGNPVSSAMSLSEHDIRCHRPLRGKTLRIGAIKGDQFIRYERVGTEGHFKNGAGIFYSMVSELSHRKNFTILLEPINGSGAKLNGTWTLAMGDLVANRVDMVFPLAVSYSRNPFIDYTSLVDWYDRMFWVPAPPVRVSAWAFAQPFTLFVWILSLAATLLSTLVFAFMLVQSEPGAKWRSHLSYSVEAAIRVVLEQSFAMRGKWKGTMRVTFSIWVFVTLILTTAYRSKLYFFLTFLAGEPVPRTHRALAFSSYNIVFRTYGGVALTQMQKSKDPVHKALLSKKNFSYASTSAQCILSAVSQEKAACLDYQFSGEFAIAANATLRLDAGNGNRNLLIPSADFDSRAMIIWAFPKGSVFKNEMSESITRIHASGLYGKWVQEDRDVKRIQSIRWYKSSESAIAEKLKEVERMQSGAWNSLAVRNLKVAFIQLVLSLIVATCLFTVEFLTIRTKFICNMMSQNGNANMLLLHSYVKPKVGSLAQDWLVDQEQYRNHYNNF